MHLIPKNEVDISANDDIMIDFEPFSILKYIIHSKSIWSFGINDEILIEHCNSIYFHFLSAETFETIIISRKSTAKPHFLFQKY